MEMEMMQMEMMQMKMDLDSDWDSEMKLKMKMRMDLDSDWDSDLDRIADAYRLVSREEVEYIKSKCHANFLSIDVQPKLDKQVELYGTISAEFLDRIADAYCLVSREEVEYIKSKCHTPSSFLMLIQHIDELREFGQRFGSESLETRCLANILSIAVQPKLDRQVELYGTISAEFFDPHERRIVHEIYTRGSDEREILGTEGTLTLNGPDFMCWSPAAGFPLHGSRVKVKLFDQTDKIFAKKSFCLDDIGDGDDYEQVKSKVVPCQQCSLTLKYIAVPFGVHCRLQVEISSLKDVAPINVNGKIVARYDHTYGKYSSEEYVLFKKQDTEFWPVEIGEINFFPLSRYWVSVSACSPLIIEVDLSECGSGRKIVSGIIKLLSPNAPTGCLISDDVIITVGSACFSPFPLGSGRNLAQEIQDRDTDGEDKSSSADDVYYDCDDCDDDDDDDDDDEDDDEDDGLGPHKDKLRLSPAVEIFSVLIGREKSKAVQIYGSIEFLCGFHEICCIFKRDEKYAFGLSENLESIPIPDGSRLFDECWPLKIKCDIKDVEGCLAIKGYAEGASGPLDPSWWYEKQLCSFIQGQHGGFAAIHYSLFEEAVGVNIKVSLNVKTGGVDVTPKVWGSLVTQYSHYDYSSRYNKDYYRSVLFKRTRDDLIQISNDLTIPLSRSTIVVPSYSALVVNVDLSFGVAEQKLSCFKMIKIGEDLKTEEIGDYVLNIELDWCEIK